MSTRVARWAVMAVAGLALTLLGTGCASTLSVALGGAASVGNVALDVVTSPVQATLYVSEAIGEPAMVDRTEEIQFTYLKEQNLKQIQADCTIVFREQWYATPGDPRYAALQMSVYDPSCGYSNGMLLELSRLAPDLGAYLVTNPILHAETIRTILDAEVRAANGKDTPRLLQVADWYLKRPMLESLAQHPDLGPKVRARLSQRLTEDRLFGDPDGPVPPWFRRLKGWTPYTDANARALRRVN